MTPPRTVPDLLREFDNAKVTDADSAIESSLWAKRFRDYLRKKGLDDLETTLKFMVLTQPFKARHASKKASSANKTRQEMNEIYTRAVEQFFSEENDQVNIKPRT